MGDFGSGRERQAREDYRCHLCDGKIPAGSRYTRYAGKWQGEIQNWTAHTACYAEHDGEECPYPGPNAWLSSLSEAPSQMEEG